MMNKNIDICIVGGGLGGMLIAANLCKCTTKSFSVAVFNQGHAFARGVAYSPYSEKLLLNVAAGKMSAYSDKPLDFVDWAAKNSALVAGVDEKLIENAFLPRYLYGEYLEQVWSDTLELSNITIEIFQETILDVVKTDQGYLLSSSTRTIHANQVVLATGNSKPASPNLKNRSYEKSVNYHGNPWLINSIQVNNTSKDILILGSGLTMTDSVIALHENGFNNKIYTLSPHGYSPLPHSNIGKNYFTTHDIGDKFDLTTLTTQFNKQRKLMVKLGLSIDPVIDSYRSMTQKIWHSLHHSDRLKFISRLRHLWGKARHRLPMSAYEFIRDLRIEGKLNLLSGKLMEINFVRGNFYVKYKDKDSKVIKSVKVERIINCTGPSSNIAYGDNPLLKNMVRNGLIVQDPLLIGIDADSENYCLKDSTGATHSNLFAIGNLLRGVLWESTAVPEIRIQAERIAKGMIANHENNVNAELIMSKNILKHE